jgi:2,3-diaminopropionate biosynthesis protein SbnA
MYDSILATAGNTPLVRLTQVFANLHFDLFAKLEAFNPGGSIKDRPAFEIIKKGLARGEILPGATIVESSSGNMGIGLAQACAYYRLRFICVVDTKTTAQNLNILRAYGAELDLVTEPDPETGEFLQARIKRVRHLLATSPNSFWPDQYSNLDNSAAHYTTMREISDELGAEVDYLFCATSTCGTARGCAEYISDHRMSTRLIAVDAIGSVLFRGQPGKRLIPGHGAGIIPQLYRTGIEDRCVKVSDLDCVVGCRRLARTESLLVGGSSGAVLSALTHIKDEIPEGANCVLIFPDRGERYMDTIYSDQWVEENFGGVSHLWKDSERVIEYDHVCQ